MNADNFAHYDVDLRTLAALGVFRELLNRGDVVPLLHFLGKADNVHDVHRYMVMQVAPNDPLIAAFCVGAGFHVPLTAITTTDNDDVDIRKVVDAFFNMCFVTDVAGLAPHEYFSIEEIGEAFAKFTTACADIDGSKINVTHFECYLKCLNIEPLTVNGVKRYALRVPDLPASVATNCPRRSARVRVAK